MNSVIQKGVRHIFKDILTFACPVDFKIRCKVIVQYSLRYTRFYALRVTAGSVSWPEKDPPLQNPRNQSLAGIFVRKLSRMQTGSIIGKSSLRLLCMVTY